MILQTKNLSKKYNQHYAVNNVNLAIPHGSIMALIGQNGAGKSTLLKMIAGLAQPSSGEIFFFQENIVGGQGQISSLIESPGHYAHLSAEQNLRAKYLALGIKSGPSPQELLKIVGLGDVGTKKVGKFSMGMKQRLGIALSLVGSPDLVLLDEPINGLDPQGIAEFRHLIQEINQKQKITFIISSHILEELVKMASHFTFIDQGKLVEQLTYDELMAKNKSHIVLTASDPEAAVIRLDELGFNNYLVNEQKEIYIYDALDKSVEIIQRLEEKNIKVLELEIKRDRLEDYYFKLVGGENV